jgi:hypothetical protein
VPSCSASSSRATRLRSRASCGASASTSTRAGQASSGWLPGTTETPQDLRPARETDAAAHEAAGVGGRVPADEDPARRPVDEAGGGQAEGFERAEEDIRENAEHGRLGPRDPRREAFAGEEASDIASFGLRRGGPRALHRADRRDLTAPLDTKAFRSLAGGEDQAVAIVAEVPQPPGPERPLPGPATPPDSPDHAATVAAGSGPAQAVAAGAARARLPGRARARSEGPKPMRSR